MARSSFNSAEFGPPILLDGTDTGLSEDTIFTSVQAARKAGLTYENWEEINPDAADYVDVLCREDEAEGPSR